MTGAEDPAAAGRDRLRAGHADREQAIEALKDAFVQGRLTRDELDVRAGRALAARTRAELAALTADIPASGRGRAGPAAGPAPVRRPLARAAARSGICLVIAVAAVRVAFLLDPDGPGPSPSFLGSLVPCRGLFRRADGTRHRDPRGGHRSGAEALPGETQSVPMIATTFPASRALPGGTPATGPTA